MELLDIVDRNKNLTGEIIDREIVHEKGFYHRRSRSYNCKSIR